MEADIGVTLRGPRPAEAATRMTAAPASPPIAPTAGVSSPVTLSATEASYEQLQHQLQARGVSWQQLKTGLAADEWLFVCAVPHPGQNNLERHYEARAVGSGGLAAIRAVIQEIDKDRNGQ
jgi:hypothetical protein